MHGVNRRFPVAEYAREQAVERIRIHRIAAPLVAADVDVVHVILLQQVKVFLRVGVEARNVHLALTRVQPVVVQPQIRPADDVLPGDGRNRVQVLRPGHVGGMLRRVIAGKFPRFHRRRGKRLIVADALAPERQPRGQEHRNRRHERQRPAPTHPFQPMPDLTAPVRHNHAAKQPRQIHQLVVVVDVRLKAHQLHRKDNRQRAREQPSMLRIPLEQRQNQHQERQTDVLQVEPEVQVAKRKFTV